jgi:hypothetical protein
MKDAIPANQLRPQAWEWEGSCAVQQREAVRCGAGGGAARGRQGFQSVGGERKEDAFDLRRPTYRNARCTVTAAFCMLCMRLALARTRTAIARSANADSAWARGTLLRCAVKSRAQWGR